MSSFEKYETYKTASYLAGKRESKSDSSDEGEELHLGFVKVEDVSFKAMGDDFLVEV